MCLPPCYFHVIFVLYPRLPAYALGFLDCKNISARCMLTIFQLVATHTCACCSVTFLLLFRYFLTSAYALGFLDCKDISARCMLTIFQFFATHTCACCSVTFLLLFRNFLTLQRTRWASWTARTSARAAC
jgi:hypothetical protein